MYALFLLYNNFDIPYFHIHGKYLFLYLILSFNHLSYTSYYFSQTSTKPMNPHINTYSMRNEWDSQEIAIPLEDNAIIHANLCCTFQNLTSWLLNILGKVVVIYTTKLLDQVLTQSIGIPATLSFLNFCTLIGRWSSWSLHCSAIIGQNPFTL